MPLKRSYRGLGIDGRDYSKIVYDRKENLDTFEELILEGCSEEVALRTIRVSRSTYYRWKTRFKKYGLFGLEADSKRPHKVRSHDWDNDLVEKVIFLRRKYPFFGKQKITIFLKKDCSITASESTIGRILSELVAKGSVQPVSFYTGKYEPKKRMFNNHAKRIPRGLKAQNPGELVQIDHTSLKLDSGHGVKHFEAMCPTTRFSVGKAYRKASSFTATKFLEFIENTLPFKLLSIQVDGGSEFMGTFEKACKSRNIPLYVLPPRSPKLNAFVERGNGIVKEEFYSLYDKSDNLNSINNALQEYKLFYNSSRPHSGLQNLSPLEYYQLWEDKSV